ncbi:MAG: ABC transporter ATP-binding protein [Akkermansiaceae bacterium]|jgi:oligopeptide/dipeptide ABC transporter ATP-binding protein|nr:ABC transporter ATP-binding protein [Akkermansiaceae bacterium]
MTPETPILTVRDLRVHFPVRRGIIPRPVAAVKAVDGVSLAIAPGRTIGLVGESGCGKTTLGKAIVRLLKPVGGSIHFHGVDITAMGQRRLRPLRRQFQMIFQDPAESLDPRMSVRGLIEEPLVIHRIGNRRERRAAVNELLDLVGLPAASADRYPFEFSGGQRQRIGIARALALRPGLIICDEPVSALDVSVQSQILNLLVDLQREFGLAYLFIAHDLSVVKHISDTVAVMYLGRIVEMAASEEIYRNPRHAYSQALLAAIPSHNPRHRETRTLLEGDVPSPIDPPAGSAFGHRMGHPLYEQTIGADLSLREFAPGHWVAADPCCVSAADHAALSKAPVFDPALPAVTPPA